LFLKSYFHGWWIPSATVVILVAMSTVTPTTCQQLSQQLRLRLRQRLHPKQHSQRRHDYTPRQHIKAMPIIFIAICTCQNMSSGLEGIWWYTKGWVPPTGWPQLSLKYFSKYRFLYGFTLSSWKIFQVWVPPWFLFTYLEIIILNMVCGSTLGLFSILPEVSTYLLIWRKLDELVMVAEYFH
jgi:hypothetical protein